MHSPPVDAPTLKPDRFTDDYRMAFYSCQSRRLGHDHGGDQNVVADMIREPPADFYMGKLETIKSTHIVAPEKKDDTELLHLLASNDLLLSKSRENSNNKVFPFIKISLSLFMHLISLWFNTKIRTSDILIVHYSKVALLI